MRSQRDILIAWSFYDWATSSFSSIIQTYLFATYFVTKVAPTKDVGVSQWGLMMGLASLFVAVTAPFLGALADQGGHRKGWLLVCTVIVVACTAALWGVYPDPSYALMGLILVGIATIAEESAFIFYNALLPEIASKETIGRWSGWGWAMGYIGGTLILGLSLLIFLADGTQDSSALAVRSTFLLCAGWIGVFSIPLFLIVPDSYRPAYLSVRELISKAIFQVRHSFKQMRKSQNLFLFLVARMLYTDALITLFTFGGIYAAAQFNMEETRILLFGIGLNVTAGLGAALFAYLDDLWGGKSVVMGSLAALLFTSAMALSVDKELYFWFWGLLIGIFVGPIQASSRSYMARLTPKETLNEMFGFFAFSSKVTAFLGPLTVSWITALTGNLRLGMVSILFYAFSGFVLMSFVNKDK